MKRETLALETPARSATSSMVTRLRWAAEKSFTVESSYCLKPVSEDTICTVAVN
jgi:hypothetical protein